MDLLQGASYVVRRPDTPTASQDGAGPHDGAQEGTREGPHMDERAERPRPRAGP
jgi:hypothetical protein